MKGDDYFITSRIAQKDSEMNLEKKLSQNRTNVLILANS